MQEDTRKDFNLSNDIVALKLSEKETLEPFLFLPLVLKDLLGVSLAKFLFFEVCKEKERQRW